jgi:hypothetical protein
MLEATWKGYRREHKYQKEMRALLKARRPHQKAP